MLVLSSRRSGLATALPAYVVLALSLLGCSSSSRLPTAVSAVRAPDPNTPVAAVEFLQWCWTHRDIAHYHQVFTDDFSFAFTAADTAGDPFLQAPWTWTREDEIISAQHIFGAASSITLPFEADLHDQPDLRPGKTDPVHRQVQIANLTLTINRKDGGGYRVTGGALFYLVRGDSAAIPQELEDRGFKPVPTRWYVERWEDQTGYGAVPASATGERAPAAPARPLPTRKLSWGGIKLQYR
jgi:hypothetical protein